MKYKLFFTATRTLKYIYKKNFLEFKPQTTSEEMQSTWHQLTRHFKNNREKKCFTSMHVNLNSGTYLIHRSIWPLHTCWYLGRGLQTICCSPGIHTCCAHHTWAQCTINSNENDPHNNVWCFLKISVTSSLKMCLRSKRERKRNEMKEIKIKLNQGCCVQTLHWFYFEFLIQVLWVICNGCRLHTAMTGVLAGPCCRHHPFNIRHQRCPLMLP